MPAPSMKSTIRSFNSLSEFIDHCAVTPEQGRQASGREDDGSFFGTRTFDEACTLAFSWREGAERIERAKARLGITPQRVRKVPVMREVGPGVISMGNYLSGHPQPYIALADSTDARKGRGKIVRLMVNVGASGACTPREIENRGAAVLLLAAALEAAGVRTEISAAFTTSSTSFASREMIGYVWTVKRAEQKFNPVTLAFTLAHPSMGRRFGFAALEREDAKTRAKFGVGASYGGWADIPEDRRMGALYLPEMKGGEWDFKTEDRAAAWVRKTAAGYGVTIK